MKVRVLLADDHVLVRQGIGVLLEQDPDVEIAGVAATGRDAIALASSLKPDLVLMDVVMTDMNGAEATRQIVSENPGMKVLVLSMYDDQVHITTMLEAGASGYVLKTSAYDELARAMRAVLRGELYLCGDITAVIVKSYVAKMRAGSPQSPAALPLSTREREVLTLLSEGKSSKGIARLLGVSPKTVDSHRMHIMKKLSISSIAGLTRYAMREGLTTAEL